MKYKSECKMDYGNKYDIATNKIYYYFRQYKYHTGSSFIFSPDSSFCKIKIINKVFIITMNTKINYYNFTVVDNNAVWIDYVSPAFNNVFDFLNAIDYYIKNKKEWNKSLNYTIFNDKNEFINCIIKMKHGGKNRYKLTRIL